MDKLRDRSEGSWQTPLQFKVEIGYVFQLKGYTSSTFSIATCILKGDYLPARYIQSVNVINN